MPRANRRFLARAVQFAAEHGVRQFLDMGTGLPSQGHVHEIVGDLTSEGHPPDLVARKEEIFARSNAPVSYRSRTEILRMFSGFDLVEPGLTAVTQWRGDDLDHQLDAAGQWWLAGVGRRS